MPQTRLIRIAELSLPAVLALAAAVALVYALATLGFNWELYVGEQENVYFVHQLAAHGSLYRDWGGLDLLFPIYPPGFFAVVAPLSWIGGTDLWSARLVSILATALAALAAARIASRLGANRIEALSSGIAFFALPTASIVFFGARPDALVLALSAAMLLGATHWESSKSRNWLLLAGAAAAAILLTKQNFAPLILAVLASLWLRDRGTAVRFALGAGAAALLLGGLTELLSGGAFLQDLRDFSHTGYSLASLDYVLKGFLLPVPNPVLALGAVEAALLLRSPRSAPAVAWAWPAALLILLTAIKVGAATNYGIGLDYVSAILLGPALARARALGGRGLAAAIAAGLALMLAPGAIQSARDLRGSLDHLSDLRSTNEAAVERIEAAGGRLFGDRLDLALAAHQPPGLDGAISAQLAGSGYWDPAVAARALRAGRFGVVQTSFDLNGPVSGWPLALTKAAQARYCPYWSRTVSFPGQSIYLYKPCRGGRS